MNHFPLSASVEEALERASVSPRDDLGYCYYTFRVILSDLTGDWASVLSRLIDAGWQLQGGPYVIEKSRGVARHLILSMLYAESLNFPRAPAVSR